MIMVYDDHLRPWVRQARGRPAAGAGDANGTGLSRMVAGAIDKR
jgi:hypothetical protein